MKRNLWKSIKAELAIWRIGALPGVTVIALVVIARLTGSLQALEWAALDRFLRWRPAEAIDSRIVIVGINETDIRRTGTYPIPDRDIAALLQKLQTYQPAVIGLDIFRDLPVEPGHAELIKTLRSTPNLIAIDKVLPDQSGFTVNPPPTLPPEQIGFADAVLDADGYLRRSLLGTYSPQGDYRFSLSIRLAQTYLATQGFSLDNGTRDPIAMRFGSRELTRFQPNSGGYVRAAAGGNQILVNFRSGRHPFRHLSLYDLQTGKVNADWLRGKIVLIGITAPSVKDVISSAAIVSDNPSLIYGVEIQAHTVSQIVSAVLDQRPLLTGWSEGWEYVWIVIWGFLGISLGRFMRSAFKILLGLALASVGLVGLSYVLLTQGLWIPVVPALLVLVFNGAGLTAALFYRHEQALRSRLQDRQLIIEHTFNAIHNGPLQTLARLLSQVQSQESSSLLLPLQHLNQELRSVYESVRREALVQGNSLYLQELELDLQSPLHEVLYEVYSNVLAREFPCFQTLKIKVINFEPINEQRLSLDQKRGICRFLEEALCNVGKYAVNVTRLDVTCTQTQGQNTIRVSDNGKGTTLNAAVEGLGTQQAQQLAKQLSGKFHRFANSPHGTVCELTWSVAKSWFWQS